ncbi:MAG: hypothetical protein K6F85_06510 [Bacteroidales bacterium]|nr:hypothetical protein [Bacteroidales bacterium]
MLKKIIINILLVFCVYGSIIAQNTRDVVYLKNGGIIKGQIVEQIPGQNLKIETSDGSVFVYQTSEVEKITKEQVETTSNRLNDYQEKNYFEYKNPTAAWALSFLIPGGGQFYNGQGGKGGLMLGLYAVNVAFSYSLVGLSAYAVCSLHLFGHRLTHRLWLIK